MRKFLRIKPGPLFLASLISVLAFGSYIVLKALRVKKDAGFAARTEESGGNGAPEKNIEAPAEGGEVPAEIGGVPAEPSEPPNELPEDEAVSPPEPQPAEIIDLSGYPEPQPENGAVLKKPEADCIAPLTVEVKGASNYYVYLKYMKPPESSGIDVTPGSGADIGFFVTADSSVSLNVPVGVFSLNYAVGSAWYGLDRKFGPETKYFKADETLTFYVDRNYLYGNTVRLFPQSDASAPSRQLGAGDFPG
jgi:hypothetical protein